MAIKIGVGSSVLKDPLEAAKEAILAAKINLQEDKVDLALVFSSMEFAHPIVLETIARSLGPVPLLGCSSFAIMTNEGINKHCLSIALLSSPENIYFNRASVKDISTKTAAASGEELGENALYGFRGIRRDFGIVFFDTLAPSNSEVISGLQEKLGKSSPLISVCALGKYAPAKGVLYFDQEILKDSACMLLWGGKLNFGLGIKHGWRPLGKPLSVTKSEANIVEEIDGVPAARIYEEYFARSISQLKENLEQITTFYPIGISFAGEDEYLLRNVVAIKDAGSIVFQGDIPQGSEIRLMIGTKESCLQATRQAIDEAKYGLNGHNPDFVIVFASASRYKLLGRQVTQEFKIIKDAFGGHTPIIGIFTHGEQAPLRAISHLGKIYSYNQTIQILAIGG